jgi:hypothetical protein
MCNVYLSKSLRQTVRLAKLAINRNLIFALNLGKSLGSPLS